MKLEAVEFYTLNDHRVKNTSTGSPLHRHVHGLQKTDCNKCGLVLDDMAVMKEYHYPCIIYMREKAIGKLDKNTRIDRHNWFLKHDCCKDKICKNNCLDVCIDYNNRYKKFILDK